MAKAPGTIRQRGTSWNVIIRMEGERHEFGPRSEPLLGVATSRKEVEEWTWRKHAELKEEAETAARRGADGTPDSVPFSDLVARFRAERLPTLAPGTQAAYEDTLKPVTAYFVGQLGDPMVEDIRSRHVKDYLSWRRVNRRNGDKPLSNRTLEKDRAVLHRLFADADQWELRQGNPVVRVDRPKSDDHDPVILDEDQYERLLKDCAEGGPMLGLYALLLGETGVRAYSEALHLTWEDVDLEEGFLRITTGREGRRTKSGKSRWVPMTPRIRQAMREHFAAYRFAAYDGKRTPWIFHHVAGRGDFYAAGDRIKDMRTGFDSAAKRAKIPDAFRRHDLRHRRVTTWLADEKNPVHVKEALGHSDLRTTMGYTHLAREHLRSLVEHEGGAVVDDRRGTGA